jgi:prophage antirepressor-like protein
MASIVKFENANLNCEINTITVNGAIYFKAKDVATALDYANAKQAIIKNVDEEDKAILEDLLKLAKGPPDSPLVGNEESCVFISESGLYSLILKSKKAEAKVFKRWVTSEVLPSIRKTGEYKLKKEKVDLIGNQISIMNESDLQANVIKFIKTVFPNAVYVVGLGELQDSQWKRSYAYKHGYRGGTPDLLILNRHVDYNGFGIEFKSPTGKGRLMDKQQEFLDDLDVHCNFKTLVSCDYNEIVVELANYFKNVRIICPYCKSRPGFKSRETLLNHVRCIHKNLEI